MYARPGSRRQISIETVGEQIFKNGWSHLFESEVWVMEHDPDFREAVLRYVEQRRQEVAEVEQRTGDPARRGEEET